MSFMGSTLLLVPAVLQAWLVVILLRRGLHREFFFFFTYALFDCVASVVRFVALSGDVAYFYAYWTTEALYSILGLLAILQVFPHVLKSFSQATIFRIAMWTVVLLMIAVSAGHAVLHPPSQAAGLVGVIYSLELGVEYVQAGIFVLFIVAVGLYRVAWRKYPFGIVFGFGLSASSDLAALLLRSEFGMRYKFLFTWAPGMVYILAVLVWLFAFLKPEPPDPTEGMRSTLPPEEVIAGVKQLSKTLKGSVR